MLNISAQRKPSTTKPETMELARRMSNALITNVKSPRVSKFIGRVRITNKGFINALIIPRTKAATKAVVKLAMRTPGRK